MKASKALTEFLTRSGDAVRPHTAAEKKTQALSALVILTLLIVVYIIVI